MIKFAVVLVALLFGSIIFAVVRKMFYGGPLIEQDGSPRSLKELAEQRRSEKQSQRGLIS